MPDTLIQHVTTESFSTSTGETVRHEIVRTEILSQGINGSPGPVGPAGATGPPGTGSLVPWQENAFTLSGNQTVFVLSTTPATQTVALFVNGLRQTGDNFTVVGSTVTITGFVPGADDVVDIFFQA